LLKENAIYSFKKSFFNYEWLMKWTPIVHREFNRMLMQNANRGAIFG